MKTRIINSRLNLNISINRLLFRSKKATGEQRENIEREAFDLEYVLETLKQLEQEIEKQFKINLRLHTENLRLKKEMLSLSEIEVDL